MSFDSITNSISMLKVKKHKRKTSPVDLCHLYKKHFVIKLKHTALKQQTHMTGQSHCFKAGFVCSHL